MNISKSTDRVEISHNFKVILRNRRNQLETLYSWSNSNSPVWAVNPPVWTPKGSNPWMVGPRISPLAVITVGCCSKSWTMKWWGLLVTPVEQHSCIFSCFTSLGNEKGSTAIDNQGILQQKSHLLAPITFLFLLFISTYFAHDMRKRFLNFWDHYKIGGYYQRDSAWKKNDIITLILLQPLKLAAMWGVPYPHHGNPES